MQVQFIGVCSLCVSRISWRKAMGKNHTLLLVNIFLWRVLKAANAELSDMRQCASRVVTPPVPSGPSNSFAEPAVARFHSCTPLKSISVRAAVTSKANESLSVTVCEWSRA